MPDHTLRISNGDTTSGRLTLSNSNLKAKPDQTVKWDNQANGVVVSIVEIFDKRGFQDVWEERPNDQNGWQGILKDESYFPVKYDYEYGIRWRDRRGVIRTFDPKISIDPNKKDSLLFWIIGAAAFAFSLFGLMHLLRKKK